MYFTFLNVHGSMPGINGAPEQEELYIGALPPTLKHYLSVKLHI